MNLVLLGAPGSGKGTQAEALRTALRLTHVASGDLFREHLAHQTPLGVRVKEYLTRGALVPDEITVALLRERLRADDVAAGVVFDGFPRTVAQAEALDAMMSSLDLRLDGALYIDVPDEAIVARLSGRLICRECQVPFHASANPFVTCPHGKCRGDFLARRDDDAPETVRARLQVFHHDTEPVIAYYRRHGRFVRVAGDGAVEDVRRATVEAARRWLVEAI